MDCENESKEKSKRNSDVIKISPLINQMHSYDWHKIGTILTIKLIMHQTTFTRAQAHPFAVDPSVEISNYQISHIKLNCFVKNLLNKQRWHHNFK